jgi:hypothetical protein
MLVLWSIAVANKTDFSPAHLQYAHIAHDAPVGQFRHVRSPEQSGLEALRPTSIQVKRAPDVMTCLA